MLVMAIVTLIIQYKDCALQYYPSKVVGGVQNFDLLFNFAGYVNLIINGVRLNGEGNFYDTQCVLVRVTL